MKHTAEVTCKYGDESITEAIASSIQPDNIAAPKKIKIHTVKNENRVETRIEVEGEIETLISTLDDLLSCTSTAEKMI